VSELDLGVVVPHEDGIEERVPAQVGDDESDVVGPFPVQHDRGRVAHLARFFVHLEVLSEGIFGQEGRVLRVGPGGIDSGRVPRWWGGGYELGEEFVRISVGEVHLGRVDSASAL
jgi:hypothetical protein